MTITKRAFAWGLSAIIAALAIAAPFASAYDYGNDYRYGGNNSTRNCVDRYGYYNTNCFDDYYSAYYRPETSRTVDYRYDDYDDSNYYAYNSRNNNDYRYDSFYSYTPNRSYDNDRYNTFVYRCGDQNCEVAYDDYNTGYSNYGTRYNNYYDSANTYTGYSNRYSSYDNYRTANTNYRNDYGYNRGIQSYSNDYIQYDDDRYIRSDYYNETYSSRRADWLRRTGRQYDYWF